MRLLMERKIVAEVRARLERTIYREWLTRRTELAYASDASVEHPS